jgi:glycosyltransferase involved in cell wall biosynthesis
MPRILNVNSYHYRRGGSDVVYFEHARMLESAGWDAGYFSMNHPKNEPTPWSQHFIDEIEFGHAYGLMQKLQMAGKVVWSFEAQRKLRQLLDQFPADVAHLHCIYHHLSPSILPVFAERGVPVVMTAHDLKIACPAYKMLNRTGVCERCRDGSVLNVIKHRCVRDSLAASAVVAIESGLQRTMKTYLKHLAAVVVPSQFFLNKFVEWGWPRDRFAYIPNYVDAGSFRMASEAGAYFLYFGRLAPEKGVDTLIRAAVQAGVALRIAGTGPNEAELKALAAQLGGDVEFLGFKSGEDLRTLVREARAVVLPSQWYENAPMSVLESFAQGVPVVGARIGGIPEMVEHGHTGWLFTSGALDELADLLRQIKQLPDAAVSEMGRSARQRVELDFHRAGYLEAMLALYERLGVGRRAVIAGMAAA